MNDLIRLSICFLICVDKICVTQLADREVMERKKTQEEEDLARMKKLDEMFEELYKRVCVNFTIIHFNMLFYFIISLIEIDVGMSSQGSLISRGFWTWTRPWAKRLRLSQSLSLRLRTTRSGGGER